MELGKILTEFTTQQRRKALEKALLSKQPVLIELALQVADDIKGLETTILKHKVKYGELEYVDKILQSKMPAQVELQECIEIALKNRDKAMLMFLFEKGAKKTIAMRNAFKKSNMEDVLLLIEAGCECDYNEAIKDTATGASGKAIELLTWLMDNAPKNTINIEKFNCVIRFSYTYGRSHIAKHMLNCRELEKYQAKFITMG